MKILIKLMRLLYLKKVIKQHLVWYKNGNNLKIKQKQMRVSNNNKAVYFIINIQNPCGWNFKAVFKSCASLALLSNCDVVDSFNNLASNLSKLPFFHHYLQLLMFRNP
jgi:hypothetical protein